VKRLVHAVLRVGNDEEPELVLPAGLRGLVSGDLAIVFRAVVVEALTPTVPGLEAFATAVAELHRTHTTIPFRFGCSVESDSQLEALLRDHRGAWLSMLDRVEQCDEYSVHLPPPAEPSTHLGQPERTSTDAQIVEPTDRPGTTYLMARRNTLQRAAAVRQEALQRAEQVCQALEGLYRSYDVNPPIPGREARVTLVFLVPRASAPAFLSAVEGASQLARGCLLATGPWAPYHFTAPLPELGSGAR